MNKSAPGSKAGIVKTRAVAGHEFGSTSAAWEKTLPQHHTDKTLIHQ